MYALMINGCYDVLRENIYCYGMWSAYDGVYVLYPNLVRRELSHKLIYEISKSELICGIEKLYSFLNVEYPSDENLVLIFFDLLSRYKNIETVEMLTSAAIKKNMAQGRRVVIKYHPRETQEIASSEEAFKIPSHIPAEKVLYDLKGRDLVVWGNATTSIIVASKMDFCVYSICNLESPDNLQMRDKLIDMNIKCITRKEFKD